jgi:hypothetical protein
MEDFLVIALGCLLSQLAVGFLCFEKHHDFLLLKGIEWFVLDDPSRAYHRRDCRERREETDVAGAGVRSGTFAASYHFGALPALAQVAIQVRQVQAQASRDDQRRPERDHRPLDDMRSDESPAAYSHI